MRHTSGLQSRAHLPVSSELPWRGVSASNPCTALASHPYLGSLRPRLFLTLAPLLPSRPAAGVPASMGQDHSVDH